MVEWMSMFETVVQVALVTSHTDHFLLLTAALGAFICKDLSFPLSRVRFAVSVYMFPNFDVWHFPSSSGNGGVAQRTYRNLYILLI